MRNWSGGATSGTIDANGDGNNELGSFDRKTWDFRGDWRIGSDNTLRVGVQGYDESQKEGRGSFDFTTFVLSGESDMVVNDLSVVLSHVKSGQLRVLAAAHEKRLAPLPDVPTFREAGMPGVVSSTWWGIGVPAATPRAIVERLGRAHAEVVKRPAYAARLAELAMEPLVLDRAQTTAFVKAEIAKWRKIAAAANVKLD